MLMMETKSSEKHETKPDTKPETKQHCIKVYMSDEEKTALLERMAQVGAKNRSHFIREIINQGFILDIDLSSINQLTFLLSNATNNLNQIARAVNSQQPMLLKDVDTLRGDYVALSKEVSKLLGIVTSAQ